MYTEECYDSEYYQQSGNTEEQVRDIAMGGSEFDAEPRADDNQAHEDIDDAHRAMISESSFF